MQGHVQNIRCKYKWSILNKWTSWTVCLWFITRRYNESQCKKLVLVVGRSEKNLKNTSPFNFLRSYTKCVTSSKYLKCVIFTNSASVYISDRIAEKKRILASQRQFYTIVIHKIIHIYFRILRRENTTHVHSTSSLERERKRIFFYV